MQDKKELQARLTKLRAGSVKPVSKVEKERTERELKRLQKAVRNRKKIRMELWQTIQAFAPKEQWEDIKDGLDLNI